LAKKSASRVISRAQEVERNKFGESLEEADGKGNVFRIAKQIVSKNRDVVAGGCVKDQEGKIVVEDIKIQEV
jgi:hypothetical protein